MRAVLRTRRLRTEKPVWGWIHNFFGFLGGLLILAAAIATLVWGLTKLGII